MARKSERQKIKESKEILSAQGMEIVEKGFVKCTSCGSYKSVKQSNFYLNRSTLYEGCEVTYDTPKGVEKTVTVLPICKSCIEKIFRKILIESKNNEKLATYKLTQELRLPWLQAIWDSVCNEDEPHKLYVGRCNSIPGYKTLTMADSEEFIGDDTTDSQSINGKVVNDITRSKKAKAEAVKLWGDTWTDFELSKLEKFRVGMLKTNAIKTTQDQDYLYKIALLSVQIDKAICDGESGKAKQLGDLYSKYMADSKFRASDMTDADKQGGIRTFSQIFNEVELKGFIPPWVKYGKLLNVTQDIVDKAIMHLENFTLSFNKSSKMTEPPKDTPKVESLEMDGDENGFLE